MAGASATTAVRPLAPQFADDHHAFHEDAKPGDLTGQIGTRRSNSSKQLVTRINRESSVSADPGDHHEALVVARYIISAPRHVDVVGASVKEALPALDIEAGVHSVGCDHHQVGGREAGLVTRARQFGSPSRWMRRWNRGSSRRPSKIGSTLRYGMFGSPATSKASSR